MATPEELGIDKWSREDRLQLYRALWDSLITEDGGTRPPGFYLTEEQSAELRRRSQEHDENPGDAIPAEEVHAAVRRRSAG